MQAAAATSTGTIAYASRSPALSASAPSVKGAAAMAVPEANDARALAASVRPPDDSMASARVSGYSSDTPVPVTPSDATISGGTYSNQNPRNPAPAIASAPANSRSGRMRVASHPPATRPKV